MILLEVGGVYMDGIAIKSSEVREHFSETFDDVIRKSPKMIVRRRDKIMMMNMEHMASLVSEITYNVDISQDDDGSYLASLSEIEDIFEAAETTDAALHSIANALIEYATDYMQINFTLYFNAPNRKKHFPYVFKVMMQNTVDDVIKLFSVKHQKS
jgi:predicted RNase H-like HicB family nuclease